MPQLNLDCINPRDDPEIIWLAEQVKKYKGQGFYGTISLHMEGGVLKRLTTEQTHLLPRNIIPTPPA